MILPFSISPPEGGIAATIRVSLKTKLFEVLFQLNQVSQEWALNTVLALNSGSLWWSVVIFWTLITGKTIAHSHFHVILVWHKAKPNNDNIISLCFSQIIMKFNCNNLFSNWPLLEAREACLNILSANIWDVKQHLNLLNLNLQWHDYHLSSWAKLA